MISKRLHQRTFRFIQWTRRWRWITREDTSSLLDCVATPLEVGAFGGSQQEREVQRYKHRCDNRNHDFCDCAAVIFGCEPVSPNCGSRQTPQTPCMSRTRSDTMIERRFNRPEESLSDAIDLDWDSAVDFYRPAAGPQCPASVSGNCPGHLGCLQSAIHVQTRTGVAFRPADGDPVEADFDETAMDALLNVAPWRTFRWFKGQKHYSGTWWSATEGRHVIHESRHELSYLLLADFSPGVERIVAQPFHLLFPTRPKPITHTPDFLVGTNRGAIVIDVTWPDKLKNPKIVHAMELTKAAVEARGWRYAVITGYARDHLANVRFLAGYRRDWLINRDALAELRTRGDTFVGMSLGEVIDNVRTLPTAQVRSALFHLLWRHEVHVDLGSRLTPETVIEVWP